MTQLEQAAKQALEAMEKTTYTFLDTEGSHGLQEQETIEQVYKAITALRAALEEQPAEQQEPVAWLHNGKLHEFDPSDWATGPVTPLYTSPPAKPWVNPSLKEYEDTMLANITPRTNDERDGIMGALSDMVVLLQEKNA